MNCNDGEHDRKTAAGPFNYWTSLHAVYTCSVYLLLFYRVLWRHQEVPILLSEAARQCLRLAQLTHFVYQAEVICSSFYSSHYA